MNIFFSVSSHTNISNDYIDDANYISDKLSNNHDLVIGVAMEEGMASKIINNFRNNNRNIFLKTLKIYNEDINKFNYINFEYFDTTFDRCRGIYQNSDILIMMPGGTGTTSEIFSFLEEKRTIKDDKDIIIYNKDNYYTNIIEMINNYVNNNFNDDDIFNYIKFFNDKDDLINYIENKEEK